MLGQYLIKRDVARIEIVYGNLIKKWKKGQRAKRKVSPGIAVSIDGVSATEVLEILLILKSEKVVGLSGSGKQLYELADVLKKLSLESVQLIEKTIKIAISGKDPADGENYNN